MRLAAVLLGLRSLFRREVHSCLRGWSALPIRNQPVLHGPCDTDECLVHVDVILCGALPEGNAEFFGKLLAFGCTHDLLVEHVALVPNKNFVDMHICMLLDLGNPVADALEAATIRDIVHEQNALSAAEVARCDGAEALLPGGVPNLQLNASSINVNVLDFEVDPDGSDEGRRERVIGITQQKAGFPDPAVSDHEKLNLHIVWG
jgi:hypothetical protein